MARLVRKGICFAGSYELETDLVSAISKLKLKGLSRKQDNEVRELIGRAIGAFLSERSAQPSTEVKQLLAQVAEACEIIRNASNALTPGLQHDLYIETATFLTEALGYHPAFRSQEEVHSFFENVAKDVETLGSAAQLAAHILADEKQRGGRKPHTWYLDFTKAVVQLCCWNGVNPTVSTDRSTGKVGGRCLAIATELERLLPPEMRSQSSIARAQRLKRNLRLLKAEQGQNQKS